MRHFKPWEENWYDRRARENNPLRNDFTDISSDLERLVNSIGNNHSNNDSIRRAGIGSSLLLAAYTLLITACVGQAAPTLSPTSTAQRAISTPVTRQEISTSQPTIEAKVADASTSTQPQVSAIIGRPTYNVILPFKEPSNDLEEYVLKNTDVVTYMKFARFKENIKWDISFADLVNQTWSINKWTDFFKRNQELGKLIPYVPLEDITKYQQGQPDYRGTNKVDEAKPIYSQQTATGELIPIRNLVVDEQFFEDRGISTLEVNVHEDILYSSDGDRDIRVRVLYDDKIAAEYIKNQASALPSSTTAEGLIKDNLTKQVIEGIRHISSKYMNTDAVRSRIFNLEFKLLGSLMEFGVVNVDIRLSE